ncbi:MAG: transporter substrate-binding domain-containing protein [Moorea sp. SIO2B7]|nr:transporter substrate-binding domain-containing protein [Moorena sp. SIO2B7]
MISKENKIRINANGNLENITIGLLEGTTTEELIKSKYPLANIQYFQGVTGRLRGIQNFLQGKIDTFASDGILLIGEIIKQEGIEPGLFLTNYSLVPKVPLTCDYYGMIIPKNDPQWQNLVNSVIQSQEFKQVLRNWFGVLFDNKIIAEEFCQG